jgi:hypothetical protein
MTNPPPVRVIQLLEDSPAISLTTGIPTHETERLIALNSHANPPDERDSRPQK